METGNYFLISHETPIIRCLFKINTGFYWNHRFTITVSTLVFLKLCTLPVRLHGFGLFSVKCSKPVSHPCNIKMHLAGFPCNLHPSWDSLCLYSRSDHTLWCGPASFRLTHIVRLRVLRIPQWLPIKNNISTDSLANNTAVWSGALWGRLRDCVCWGYNGLSCDLM